MRSTATAATAATFAAIFLLAGCSIPEPPKAADSPAASSAQPAPSSAAPAEDGPDGSRAAPLPAGAVVEDGGWKVTIGATNVDATAAVAADNEFIEPAPEGTTYIAVPVTAEYVGDEKGNTLEVLVAFVPESGATLDGSETIVGASDENPVQDLYPGGGSASWNAYFAVPSGEIATGLVRVQLGILGEERFVALQ